MAEHDLPHDMTLSGYEGRRGAEVAPMLPEFTTAVRGYDRGQVDEYIERLHDWLADAEERARAAEGDQMAAAEHIEALNRQLLSLERQSGAPTPRSITTYVERMKEIVLEAVDAAQRFRDEAYEEGDGIRQAATHDGEAILGQAKAEAAEILAAVHAEERSVRQQIAELVTTRERLVHELAEMQDQLSRLLHRPGATPPDPTPLDSSFGTENPTSPGVLGRRMVEDDEDEPLGFGEEGDFGEERAYGDLGSGENVQLFDQDI